MSDRGDWSAWLAGLDESARERAQVLIDPDTDEPTGREIAALHESLTEVDPTGREAAGFIG